MVQHSELKIQTSGKGLHDITSEVSKAIKNFQVSDGYLNIFIRHTSASLIIQENADPTARQDLEEFIDRMAPENQNWHRHTLEGPDDTTSHLKSAVTNSHLSIPLVNGQLGLGTWQGIYLWEHRQAPHLRNIVLSLLS